MRFSSFVLSFMVLATTAAATLPNHRHIGRIHARSTPRKRQNCKASASNDASGQSFNLKAVETTTVSTPVATSTRRVRPTSTRITSQKPKTTTTAKAATTTKAATTAKPATSTPAGTGLNAAQQRYLNGHNEFRSKHGAAALTWSAAAESAAQAWANKCVFQHGGGKAGGFGENLAAGTGDYAIESAIKGWTVDEVAAYNPQNPVPSHFTQVVWKGTKQVGCAVAVCNNIFPGRAANYHVCEYFPAGNVIGFFAQNVQL